MEENYYKHYRFTIEKGHISKDIFASYVDFFVALRTNYQWQIDMQW